MSVWFRSLGVFGTAFAAVVVLTMGVAGAIVPTAGGEQRATDATPDPSAAPAPTAPARPTAVGGTLAVTGDREASFVLERETTQDGYGLAGDDGRIRFRGGDPVTVDRVQYDGLEFFVDPDECTVTPGERHDPTGVAGADIRCEAIEDVRGNGTIGLEGRLGVAADLFGLRGDLPPTGGSGRLGEETLTFPSAHWVLLPFAGAFAGQVVDEDVGAAIGFSYDPMTHGLSVHEVQYGGDAAPVAPGACSVTEREIGMLNPHTRVVELSVRCDAIDIPTLGEVPLETSLIAELSEPPR